MLHKQKQRCRLIRAPRPFLCKLSSRPTTCLIHCRRPPRLNLPWSATPTTCATSSTAYTPSPPKMARPSPSTQPHPSQTSLAPLKMQPMSSSSSSSSPSTSPSPSLSPLLYPLRGRDRPDPTPRLASFCHASTSAHTPGPSAPTSRIRSWLSSSSICPLPRSASSVFRSSDASRMRDGLDEGGSSACIVSFGIPNDEVEYDVVFGGERENTFRRTFTNIKVAAKGWRTGRRWRGKAL